MGAVARPNRRAKCLHALTLRFPITLERQGFAPLQRSMSFIESFVSEADETNEDCAVAIRLERRWVSTSLSAHSLQEAANATLKGHRAPLMELPPPRAMPLGGTSRRRVGAFMRRGCWGGPRRPSDPLSRSSTSGADKLPHRFVNSVPASAQPCESNLLAREVTTGRAAPSFCELSVDGQNAHGVTSSCRWGAPPLSYPRQWPRR